MLVDHKCVVVKYFRFLYYSPSGTLFVTNQGFVSCTSTHSKNTLQILISEDSSLCLHRNKKYVQKFVIPEKSRLPGRPIQMWENNVKMDLRETGCASAD